MKRCLLIVIISFLIAYVISGQVRHVKGHDFIGLYGGYGKEMYSVAGTYQKYFTNRMSGKISGLYEWLSISKTGYNSVSIYPQFEYCVLTNNVNLFLNIRPGVFSGVEFIRDEFKNRKSLFLGQSIGLGLEFFVSSKFKIDVSIDERIYQRSKVLKSYCTLYFGFSKQL